MYWVYGPKTNMWRNQYVMAELVTPVDHIYDGMQSPLQAHPYETKPEGFIFRVNPKHKHPDNYSNGTGFRLYSKRLIDLMKKFAVKFEYFPVTIVDKNGREQPDLAYYIFHSLEGIQDALDEEKSDWQGIPNLGVPRIILDDTKFDPRPIFICDKINITLMRDDLKQAIEKEKITGFEFFKAEEFATGRYGMGLVRQHQIRARKKD